MTAYKVVIRKEENGEPVYKGETSYATQESAEVAALGYIATWERIGYKDVGDGYFQKENMFFKINVESVPTL